MAYWLWIWSDYPNFLAPTGYLHLSIKDWAKFILVHLDTYPVENHKFLKADILKSLHTPPDTKEFDQKVMKFVNYALGWFTYNITPSLKLMTLSRTLDRINCPTWYILHFIRKVKNIPLLSSMPCGWSPWCRPYLYKPWLLSEWMRYLQQKYPQQHLTKKWQVVIRDWSVCLLWKPVWE